MKRKSIDRRAFLRRGGKGVVATAVLAACRPTSATPGDASPSTTASKALATPGEIASAPSTRPQIEAVCRRTAKNIEGPFFRDSAPFRGSIVPKGTPPKKVLHLSGQVFDSECKPVAGAVLEFWQADESGDYDHRGFHMRTRMKTDAAGGYSLESIVPGRYLNGDQYRPAHIHVKVHVLGHRSLTTQLYVAGDPYNSKDPWYVPTLEMKVREASAKGQFCHFDFYLGDSA